jgi:hypothetical protein
LTVPSAVPKASAMSRLLWPPASSRSVSISRRLSRSGRSIASKSVVTREAILADTLAPKGTARDYARIMAGVAARTLISPEVSELMSGILQWPMGIPVVADRFFAWGQKGGSLVGVVTDTNFFVPRGGDFAGKRRVAILFLRRLPKSAISALLTGGGQTLFDAALANDRAFFDRVATRLAEPYEESEQ